MSDNLMSNLVDVARAVIEDPFNLELRLVYADLLQEDGDTAHELRQRNIAFLLDGRPKPVRVPVTPDIRTLCLYFNYSGRKVELVCQPTASHNESENGEWDDGSMHEWAYMTLPGTGMTLHTELLSDTVCVHHSIFCGKDTGISIHGWPDTIANLLAPDLVLTPPMLSWAERVVLSATRTYKANTFGNSNYRENQARRETGITPEQWSVASVALMSKGMLKSNGAITSKGRNAIGNTNLYILRREKEVEK